jgi:hypothetical protein
MFRRNPPMVITAMAGAFEAVASEVMLSIDDQGMLQEIRTSPNIARELTTRRPT